MEDRVRIAARHWQLTVGEKLAGGTRSAVYAATDGLGRDLVLKLPQARTIPGGVTSVEAAALRAWQHTGASVTLVDATPDALLLMRARPGTPLPWQPAQLPAGSPDQPPDEPPAELIGVAADLLIRLWSVDPGPYHFPTVSEVYPQNERVAREDAAYEQRIRGEPERGSVGLSRMPAASAAAARLISVITNPTLLHGDFVSKNLVRDDASPPGWVALDPLPMIGDRACEVAAFAAYQPARLILPIAEALAAQVAVDPHRARAWAGIWAVHQCAQAWREDQEDLDRLVGSRVVAELLRSG